MDERISLIDIRLVGSRAEIHLSTHERPLVLSPETVHRYRLVKGTVLTRSQAAQLETEAARFAVASEATRLLARRPHSAGELRQKLLRQFDAELVGAAIRDFTARGVLDDAQYAHQLADSLVRRKPCGCGYVIAFLESRRIERALAAEAADAVLSEHSPEELAERALRAKWREFGQFDLETARRRAYNYLARRGFPFDIARAAVQTLARESTDGGND